MIIIQLHTIKAYSKVKYLKILKLEMKNQKEKEEHHLYQAHVIRI
jgi:hypothetical protein